MAESDHSLRKKRRFSSFSVRDTTSKNLMASKLQNQSKRSVRIASAVSHTGKRFLTDFCHHHASSLSGKIDTKLLRACPRVTMKNLRLRRVFSPSSISSDWDFHVKGETRTKELDEASPCDPPNSNVTREGSKDLVNDLEAVEFSQTTSPDSEMLTGELSLVKNEADPIGQVINGTSWKRLGIKLGSKVIRHPEKIFKNPGSVSYRRLLPYLMEAADADAKDPKNERGESMGAKDEPVLRSANSFVKPSPQSLCGNISPSKKMTSSNATKVSLCSRRKLFKVPSSVNYRRMLSYLKENSEDNPGMPVTSKHTDPQKNIRGECSSH